MAPSPPTPEEARLALAAYPDTGGAAIEPLVGGLINASFAVELGGGRFVLQRVHSVFSPQIHHDIRVVTERLAARGLATPRLVPTSDGGLWVDLDQGGIWRLMTRMPGVSYDRVEEPAQAHAAAVLLARFHTALVDLDHEFQGARVGVHDTAAHLAKLEQAVRLGADHRLHGEVSRLADAILEAASELPAVPAAPERIVHGDPKFNNVLFRGTDDEARRQVVCMVDLDTVGRMPLHLELGDAWRSWCNPRGEDASEAIFDLTIFEAALDGYMAGLGFEPTPEEREAMLHGVERITLELAARFAADALLESYFGWDSSRFPAAGEHNLVRAHGQFSLFELARRSFAAREALLRR